MNVKKLIVNLVFYSICFVLVSGSVYRLAFLVPPTQDMPGYASYFRNTVTISVVIGLLVILPNLALEYLKNDD